MLLPIHHEEENNLKEIYATLLQTILKTQKKPPFESNKRNLLLPLDACLIAKIEEF